MKQLALLLALVAAPANASSVEECLTVCNTGFNYCMMHVGNSEFGIEICADAQAQCVKRCEAQPQPTEIFEVEEKKK